MVRFAVLRNVTHAESLRAALALERIDSEVRHANSFEGGVSVELWGEEASFSRAMEIIRATEEREVGPIVAWPCTCGALNDASASACAACGAARVVVIRELGEAEWKCAACASLVPHHFAACWNCGALAPAEPPVDAVLVERRLELAPGAEPPPQSLAPDTWFPRALVSAAVVGAILFALRACG